MNTLSILMMQDQRISRDGIKKNIMSSSLNATYKRIIITHAGLQGSFPCLSPLSISPRNRSFGNIQRRRCNALISRIFLFVFDVKVWKETCSTCASHFHRNGKFAHFDPDVCTLVNTFLAFSKDLPHSPGRNFFFSKYSCSLISAGRSGWCLGSEETNFHQPVPPASCR